MRVLLLLSLLAAACGYSTGQITSGEGETLAVPMFENLTYRRDLERDLTRFVREEVTARTGYTLAGAGEGADLVLHGRLVDVEEDVLSDRSRGRIRESSVALTVLITVADTRTGEEILSDHRIVERASFAPRKGESIRAAEIAVMRRIGERIVYTLGSGW